MRFIDNSKEVIDYLEKQPVNTLISIEFEKMNCRNTNDLSLIDTAFKKLLDENIIDYYDGSAVKILDLNKINQYKDFYNLYIISNEIFVFLKRNFYNVYSLYCFRDNKEAVLTRECKLTFIYNFTSELTLSVNKLLKDNNGKYLIEGFAKKCREYLYKYNLNTQLLTLKEEKKLFSEFVKNNCDNIQKLNDFRDTCFAHMDQNVQLKIKDVNVDGIFSILIKCLQYWHALNNNISDDMILWSEIQEQLKHIKIECGIFNFQIKI